MEERKEKKCEKYPCWVIIPWHYGPDEIKNEKEFEEFKKQIIKEINEMSEEEKFYLLGGATAEDVLENMEIYYSEEDAEKAWGETESIFEERERVEKLREHLKSMV